jgi:hypothetical protein
MSNAMVNEHCSTIRKYGSNIDIEQLKISFDIFVSAIKETDIHHVKCMLIEQIISSLANLPYRNKKLAESDLITHELFIILRDTVLVDHLLRRQTEGNISHKLLQNVSILFMNLYYNINDKNIVQSKQLLFHKPLIDELASCLEEIGMHGKHFDNPTLLRSVRHLLLTFKHYLRNDIVTDEYSLIQSIFFSIVQCLCSSHAIDMIKCLKQDFIQKLDDGQILFLDTIPLYLQWYTDYRDPKNFINILRMLLNEFTTWMISCHPDSYIQCTSQFGAMIRHLTYLLVRPVESENVHIFSEEFYHDYCKLVLHWSAILSSVLAHYPDVMNVKKYTARIIIQNLYNFTLHLNVLNYMKTISNLIPMLLQVTDIEDDEIQLNAYRCLGKIMREEDIKTMTNATKIASVYIDFITNTINDPQMKERFHSLLKSLKSNFFVASFNMNKV